MKKLLKVIPIALILCLLASSQVKEAETGSEDLEKELRAIANQLFKAWNESDLDTMSEIEGGAISYGYRTPAPRLFFDEKLMKWFYNSMEIFETYQKDEPIIRIVGDVGFALGTFTEKFKPKRGEWKSIEGRFSMTFIRVDGEWKLALYHRDTQFAK